MDRVVKGGYVAVVYSPGYGAGWSTWNDQYGKELMFDPGLVDLVLAGKEDEEIAVYATLKWPEAYLGGLAGVEVRWVPKGTRFYIRDDDGYERVVEFDDVGWITA